MIQKSAKQYFFIVALLSVAIALIIRFPFMMNLLFSDDGDHHRMSIQQGMTRFFMELAITFFVAFLMFTMNFFILKPDEKHGNLKKRNILLSVVLTIGAVYFLNHLLFSLSSSIDTVPQGRGHRNEFDITNFFVSALVIGCVMLLRLIFQKQNITIENEKLKREAIQSQFESLKNQLSPHFLFNSLTALKILIQEDTEKAQDYVNSLSRALRYTLQSNEKQLVTLREEMTFMESYLFLIRMRFDTNLSVNMMTDDYYSTWKLPPLTVQTLVENAIKHNEISKRKPLRIDIITTAEGTLRIENDIQKKITEEEGTRIGLINLSRQFLMLIGKEIMINQENGRFVVELPLINP